jgi:C_GCAxxG_C_C family probable redox protein
MEKPETQATKQALSLFDSGCNCAQAVLCSLAKARGLEQEAALRIATGFGGGMGRLGATCGAVTGAFMALGLEHGMTRMDQADRKESTYAAVQTFAHSFRERFGTLDCRELLGVDIGTQEGMKAAKERKLFTGKCPTYVEAAVEIVQGMR